MLATDPSPVKVEVRGLNVLTQEQYLAAPASPLWTRYQVTLLFRMESFSYTAVLMKGGGA